MNISRTIHIAVVFVASLLFTTVGWAQADGEPDAVTPGACGAKRGHTHQDHVGVDLLDGWVARWRSGRGGFRESSNSSASPDSFDVSDHLSRRYCISSEAGSPRTPKGGAHRNPGVPPLSYT